MKPKTACMVGADKKTSPSTLSAPSDTSTSLYAHLRMQAHAYTSPHFVWDSSYCVSQCGDVHNDTTSLFFKECTDRPCL